jgi:DNA mismatch repair protein MutL
LREKLLAGRYIGNFAAKYLFFETSGSFLVIDQHAAHERITFERLLDQMNTGRVEIQHLLTPLLVRLTPPERVAWEEGKQRLEEAGFPSTQWDKETAAIHAHPVLIRRPEQAFRELLSGGSASLTTKCDNAALAKKACRYSVMAGESLKEAEAESLRGDLLRCRDPFACPHGRPTVIEMTEKFLDRQFLRL